jgi:hypothetical protein
LLINYLSGRIFRPVNRFTFDQRTPTGQLAVQAPENMQHVDALDGALIIQTPKAGNRSTHFCQPQSRKN